MLKKTLSTIVIASFICICISMSGCGNTAEEPVQEKKIVVSSESISEESQPLPSTDTSIETTDTENLSTVSSPQSSYVDLTALSATAVYGQVYNMMYYPEKYVGKTITMEGLYSDYLDEATGKHYYACIIMDATACCAQGIEFTLTDNYKYPDDYPKEGDNITVTGIFDTYEEESGMYCTLKDASIIK